MSNKEAITHKINFSNSQLEKLVRNILEAPNKSATKLIAIDGRGGSGKSSLAKRLRELLNAYVNLDIKNVGIVSIDSFPFSPDIHPWNSFGTQTRIDSKRVREKVLIPLSLGKDVAYKVNSWWIGEKIDRVEEIQSGGIVLVEGCYSLLKSLRDFYDYKIWIDCSPELALESAIKRDGEGSREVWTKCYSQNEDSYISSHAPNEIADFIVDSYTTSST